MYKLVGKSRDGSDTSELAAASLAEANTAYVHLKRDGYFKVTIIGPDGRELSRQEFTKAAMAEEIRNAKQRDEA